jgi:hypothetical protein
MLTLSIYFIPMWAGFTFLLSLPDMAFPNEMRRASSGGNCRRADTSSRKDHGIARHDGTGI